MNKPPLALWEATLFLFYFLVSLILRLPSFRASVIDWDESLYFLMAEQWRAGHLPYTTLWDNKPIGIYAIFTLFQSVLGDNVAAIRWATILATTTTAFFVARITNRLQPQHTPSPVAGIGAGFAYLLASSPPGIDLAHSVGLASNTEHFFAPFVCASLDLALRNSRRPRLVALLSGLCLGVAFMIKYVAIFEGVAILSALISRRPPLRTTIPPFVAGVATPFLAALLLYAAAGQTSLFFDASLASNLRRVSQPMAWDALYGPLADAFEHWFVICAAIIGAWGLALWNLIYSPRGMGKDPKTALLLLVWSIGAFIGVASAKSFYSHYFLQLLPVGMVTAFWFTGFIAQYVPTRFRQVPAIVLLIAVVVPYFGTLALQTRQTVAALSRFPTPEDTSVTIADDLRPQLAANPGATIYVFDYQPIIYSLLHIQPPTRYAFPSFLLEKPLVAVARTDPMREFEAIIDQHPLFLIRSRERDPTPRNDRMDLYAAFNALVPKFYSVWRVYDQATVYRRVPGAGNSR